MRQDLEKTELGIKSVLGLISGTIIVCGLFYGQVIIPIRDIQVRLVSIESSLQTEKTKYDNIDAKITNVSDKLTEHLMKAIK